MALNVNINSLLSKISLDQNYQSYIFDKRELTNFETRLKNSLVELKMIRNYSQISNHVRLNHLNAQLKYLYEHSYYKCAKEINRLNESEENILLIKEALEYLRNEETINIFDINAVKKLLDVYTGWLTVNENLIKSSYILNNTISPSVAHMIDLSNENKDFELDKILDLFIETLESVIEEINKNIMENDNTMIHDEICHKAYLLSEKLKNNVNAVWS